MDNLAKLDTATRMLAEIVTIDDAKNLIDLAEAARVYAKQIELGLEAQNHAAEIKLRAQRRAGEILDKIDSSQGARTDLTILHPEKKFKMEFYEESGIDPVDAHRWQTIAKLPEKKFEEYIENTKESGDELSTAGVIHVAKGLSPKVVHNTGVDDWHTPEEYIEAAKYVMRGQIDLDPASSDKAQETIQAGIYYTNESNGLDKSWHGNVWLNPPYSFGLIDKFTKKLVHHFLSGDINQAIVLVNNSTETGWFQDLLINSSAICMVKGRIKFLSPNGPMPNSPLQGQVILYFGASSDLFAEIFSDFGIILYVYPAWGNKK